jgi:hypothetical protein
MRKFAVLVAAKYRMRNAASQMRVAAWRKRASQDVSAVGGDRGIRGRVLNVLRSRAVSPTEWESRMRFIYGMGLLALT